MELFSGVFCFHAMAWPASVFPLSIKRRYISGTRLFEGAATSSSLSFHIVASLLSYTLYLTY
jgi:hypothetical protein